jgi:8-oxo-dGTP diphosphatase
MRRWFVAAAIIENEAGVLLVQNRRRNGSLDWSTPGGVVEEHEDAIGGLAREVKEETGIEVSEWSEVLYRVETLAPDMGWHLEVAVYRAMNWSGDIVIDDPDQIVVDARFVPHAACPPLLEDNAAWVREPISDWLVERWNVSRTYRYHLAGHDRDTAVVTRA